MRHALDIAVTPLSRFGSFLSLGLQHKGVKGPGLYLRQHRNRGVGQRELFLLTVLRNGKPVEAQPVADESLLTLVAGEDRIDLALDDRQTLRVRGKGLSLRLEIAAAPGVVAHPDQDGRWVVNARHSVCRCMFEPLRGEIAVDAPWKPDQCAYIVVTLAPGRDNRFETAIDLFDSTWTPRPRPAFNEVVRQNRRAFTDWLDRTPDAPRPLRDARRHAAYVNWSAVVPPLGLLKRPSMFMSKNHMDQLWSWDHCFNAMALSYHNPELAWDQLMVMVDLQDEFGAFPDGLNPAFRHFNFSKPPVHGWALRFCMERSPRYFNRRRLAEIYAGLSKWSDWWLTHRRHQGCVLPHYLHGNDSGWDNSTMFDAGAPLVSPDLAAFLTLQVDVMADLADTLDRPRDARRWRTTSSQLVRALLDELWRPDHDRFIARRQHDGFAVVCDSLVTCMPIVLGSRLPADVQQSLVRRIRGFVTDHGLATELPSSPQYNPDGYWRGPVWAPSTLLIVDGLARIGETQLARDISRRFCDTCAASGFAENFDALTGAGLRDRAYTWTSSAFLVMAHEYLR